MHVRPQGSKAPMLMEKLFSATGVNSAKNPQEINEHRTSNLEHVITSSKSQPAGVSPRNVVNDEDIRTSMELSRCHRFLGSSALDPIQLKDARAQLQNGF